MTAEPRFTYSFDDNLPVPPDEARHVLGGKAVSLWTTRAAGLDIPPGFVISTSACRGYFRSGRRWPDGLWAEVTASLARLEAIVARRFATPPDPLLLAVRSGAAVSMPGMLQTLLNVGLTCSLASTVDEPATWTDFAELVCELARARGVALDSQSAIDPRREVCLRLLADFEHRLEERVSDDPFEMLRTCISVVFDSWHSEQAVAYRRTHALSDADGTAVIVQAMVHCEAAGVLFTRDPCDPDSPDVVVIEAVRGSGRRLVSGEATPERYVLSRIDNSGPPQWDSGSQSEPAALTGLQRQGLRRAALDLERQVGEPLDMEWGLAGGRFVFFQARPIVFAAESTSPAQIRSPTVDAVRRELIDQLRRQAARGTRAWVRHNLDETLPAPTPLTWDLVRHLMSAAGGFGRLYRGLGYRPTGRVRQQGFLECLGGRIYADPDRLAEWFCGRIPLRHSIDELRADPSLLERMPRRFAPEAADPLLLFRLPACAWTAWRTSRCVRRELPRAAVEFDQRVLPAYLEYIHAERQRDLAAVGDAELHELIERRIERVLTDFAAASMKPGLMGAQSYHDVESQLVRLLSHDDGCRLTRSLFAGLDLPESVDPQIGLWRLAHAELDLPEFLDRFGHRGPQELELSQLRWRETPLAIERAALGMRRSTRDPLELSRAARRRREQADAQLPSRLRDCGGGCFYPQLAKQLACARRLLPYREIGRHYLLQGYELIRQAIEQLARRSGLGAGIYFLQRNELDRVLSDRRDWARLAAGRRERWRIEQRLWLPDVIDAGQLDLPARAPSVPASATDEWPAAMLSAGTCSGTVWRADGETQPAVPGGYVLVCGSLDPSAAPLLLRAAGCIVERGGMLSHAAIVARQWGIPLVTLPEATRLLSDGQHVSVDADRGRVIRLSQTRSFA